MLTARQKRFLRSAAKISTAPRTDPLAARAELRSTLDRLAEDGRIAIVHGGLDCDGVQVSGCVDTLPAQAMAVERWRDRMHAQAEGPLWGHLEAPSATRGIRRHSRDLALEAFEDGHPHCMHV